MYGKLSFCSEYTRVTIYMNKKVTGTYKETHRQRLLKVVDNMSANGGTPTAFAYAEAGAYMLGKQRLA